MTLQEVMKELEKMGSDSVKKIWMKHGAREPFFGVKVGDMKSIVKKVKKDYELSLALFDTANSDAMYLAGLISDPAKMTKKDLQNWADKAYWYMLSEFAVAWTTAESPFALEMARTWIKSKEDQIASTGWSTFVSYLSITPDDQLDKKELLALLQHVEKKIHSSTNRAKQTMNSFVIGVGGYVPDLRKEAIAVAKKIGVVEVEMGGTACKTPDAQEYIQKMVDRGVANKKRKTAKC